MQFDNLRARKRALMSSVCTLRV